MAGDGSAYAALGLEPGADAAAIERAYKTLIKRYHPDRADGDAGRATEIIHAYRELRAGSKDALEFNDFDPLTGQPRLGWVGIALAVVGAILIFVVLAGSLSRLTEVPSFPLGKIPAAAAVSDAMDRPLVAGSIDRAVSDAVRINGTSDEMALASASRDCHRRLRLAPSLSQLDACAAFDDAVVLLQDRDPLRDQGYFSEIAVTRRQWSGAQAISSDNLAIDGRLDRIRLRAELKLAPPPVPEPPGAD